MPFYSIIGSKFCIGAAVALKNVPWVVGDFTTPLTAKTEVKEPETLGTYGDGWAELEFTNVTEGRTKSGKGARKAKVVELSFAMDPTDAGQLAMRTAFDATSNYAFEIELADKPLTGASPKNSFRRFIAQVMSCDDVVEAGNQMLKVTLQPNSNIVIVHASPT